MTQKLNKWLSDRSITEVECLVPDIAGIPRGKILPADKYNKVLRGSGLRLPEYVFGQTVTGDYHDSVVLNAAVGDVVLKPDENAAYSTLGAIAMHGMRQANQQIGKSISERDLEA